MQKIICRLVFILLSFCSKLYCACTGNIKPVKQKVQDKINQKVDNTTDKTMDKVLNPSTENNNTKKAAEAADDKTPVSPAESKKTMASYKNYDFVPGETIIFQSQLSDERVGEIPSQFIVTKGQVDVQEEDGENVIHIPKGPDASITPRFSETSNIPDAFTIEFDAKNEDYGVNHVNIDFGFRVGTYGPEGIMTGIGFTNNFAKWTLGRYKVPG